MRALVFFLILVNLLFFAWMQGYLGGNANPDAIRVQQQLNADRVRVVARDELPAAGAAKPLKPEKLPEDFCLVLGDLPLGELSQMESRVAEKFPSLKLERSQAAGSGSFWVFIPPLQNKQEADRKAGELKRFKVPEFYIMQEPPALRFAISLGIFSTRAAAEERLEELRGKGVRSARVGERDGKPASGTLEISGPAADADAFRQALGEWLPKAKPAACKASRSSAQ